MQLWMQHSGQHLQVGNHKNENQINPIEIRWDPRSVRSGSKYIILSLWSEARLQTLALIPPSDSDYKREMRIRLQILMGSHPVTTGATLSVSYTAVFPIFPICGGLTSNFGREGNPMTRPASINGPAAGARGVDVCLTGVSRGGGSCDCVEVTGSSGTRKVFSTSRGREITAFDDFRSTVTMVARSALPGSESVSESLRYIAI
jgi:hypothetical protein